MDPDKYDVTAASMIALLKYGTEMPFSRQEGPQGSLGIPLPASPQGTMVAEAATSRRPAHEERIRQGGQADLVVHDDTTNRILERMGKRLDKAEAKKGSAAKSATEDEAKPPASRHLHVRDRVLVRAPSHRALLHRLETRGRKPAGRVSRRKHACSGIKPRGLP